MRFAVLGTGFWAREVHARALAGHPDAELVAVWGRDRSRAQEAGAEFEVPGTDDLDAVLGDVDAVSIALPPDVQAPLAEARRRRGEAPAAGETDRAEPPRRRPAGGGGARGRGGVGRLLHDALPGRHLHLARPGRPAPRLAGGSASWLGSIAGSPFAASAWRQQHGALWDIGPHALSLLVPALGPVVAVQAAAGLRDTVHLVLHHPEGVASTVTVSSTVSPMSAGTEFSVHGDAGRLVLLPQLDAGVESFGVAVDELQAAALTGAAHPLDVSFGRDVVAVLAAAERSLATGCRQTVGS